MGKKDDKRSCKVASRILVSRKLLFFPPKKVIVVICNTVLRCRLHLLLRHNIRRGDYEAKRYTKVHEDQPWKIFIRRYIVRVV